MEKTVMTRRQVLRSVAGAGVTLALGGAAHAENARPQRCGLGIVQYALGIHQREAWAGRHQGLAPALAFLEECRQLGAGGIQIQFTPQDTAQVAAGVRRRAEADGMHIEAIIEPPADDAALGAFEQKIRIAKEAGATLARTVIMPGRRYEQFRTLAECKDFEARGVKALERAEPVLARHRFRLAVENHKTQLVAEQLAMLNRLSSEWIGVCVDVGNNLALLEDPAETVRALAPWAMTVHLKDHRLGLCPEGFLLADAALGEGILDLPALVEILGKAKPGIKYNLETITRDALVIPVLAEAYYATMPGTRATALARALALAQSKPSKAPPPVVSGLPMEQQLALERRNVERSLAYARGRLKL